MGEPVHVLNIQIITNGNMTSTVNSTAINIDKNDVASFAIQAEFTGSMMGTLQLQCSNDTPVTGDPTNWTIVTDSTQGVVAAGSYVVNVEFPAYSWVRLQYVPDSGSGTLNARINAKRR